MMSRGSSFGRKTSTGGPGNGSRFLMRASLVLAVWMIFVGAADAGDYKEGTLCLTGSPAPDKPDDIYQKQIEAIKAAGKTGDDALAEVGKLANNALKSQLETAGKNCASGKCEFHDKTFQIVCGKGSGSGTRPIHATTAMMWLCSIVSLLMVLTMSLV